MGSKLVVDHPGCDPFNQGTLGVFAIEVYVLVKIQNFKVFCLKFDLSLLETSLLVKIWLLLVKIYVAIF